MSRVTILAVALIATLLPADVQALTKWDLWSTGTKLRGANIYQRRVYPSLDGNVLGPGPIGPPYSQEDFNRLAAMGANYVNISCPGLFREKPPYKPDPAAQNNLDRLIGMIGKANLFAVISFRTGPGRSEFTFFFDDAGTWFDRSYLNDRVWKEKSAQDAWAAMWKYTAGRYRNNPVVVGYDLMVEPNSNHVWLDIWDPEQFYRQYSGTLYDWNPFFPRIIQGIRAIDGNTPILVGGMDYNALSWLPYTRPAADTHTVYTAHQYEPFEYTTQTAPLKITYPGQMDLDYDGYPDPFNRDWMTSFFSIINRFKLQYHVPVAANEYGVMRWEPGAARFLSDEMTLFEQRGMNYALWIWSGSWPAIVAWDDFDFLHGPNPNNHKNVATSQLITVIRSYWKRNVLRPSNVVFTDATGPAVALCCADVPAPAPPRTLRGTPHPLPHTHPAKKKLSAFVGAIFRARMGRPVRGGVMVAQHDSAGSGVGFDLSPGGTTELLRIASSTVPPGLEILSFSYPALRAGLSSFCPSGTKVHSAQSNNRKIQQFQSEICDLKYLKSEIWLRPSAAP